MAQGKWQPKDFDFLKKMREAAAAAEPLLKKCNLSDIHLEKDSLEKNYIVVNGTKLPVSTGFFNKLLKFLNINAKLASNFVQNKDTELISKLAEAMRVYHTKKVNDVEIYLIGDRVARLVYDFCPVSKYNRISSDVTFELAERILNDVPSLGIQSVDMYAGHTKINMLSKDLVDFSQIGKDEEFHMGFSLVTTPTHSNIDNYIWRLYCSNGMGGPEPKGGITDPNGPGGVGGPTPLGKLPIDGTDASFFTILQRIREMEKDGYMPSNFKNQLESAMNTRASLGEMEKTMYMIADRIQEEDPERKKIITESFKKQEFPLISETYARITRKGIDPSTLGPEQKKFIKTGASVWDLVNQLTWYGSHKAAGVELKNSSELKFQGGDLFVKQYDLANANLVNV